MESFLHVIASHVATGLQAVAVAVVVLGSARALLGMVRLAVATVPDRTGQRAVWLDYARWLVAALTFQLAADIVATSFAPTWEELGRLAIVAGMRTFLGFFLDREMEHAAISGRIA